jgi:hypothetical protein
MDFSFSRLPSILVINTDSCSRTYTSCGNMVVTGLTITALPFPAPTRIMRASPFCHQVTGSCPFYSHQSWYLPEISQSMPLLYPATLMC